MNTQLYNTVKAIILKADSVLLIKKEYEDGSTLFTLPGGSQEPGESLEQALKREVYEEIGATVNGFELLKVYEHRKISKKDPTIIKHKVEFAFHCQIDEAYSPRLGVHPDPHQTDVVWINKQTLSDINLYPDELENILLFDGLPDTGHYLGEVS